MTKLQSTDPATGEVVGEVTVTPLEEIAACVGRARKAQPAWEALGAEGRAERMRPAGEKLVARAEELGRLITREMGKPLREATGEVQITGAGLAEELAEIVAAVAPEVIEDARTRSTLYRDPYGVCACIAPWNFPISMPAWLVVPALATGNTVLLKPSEETPLIAQAYADVLNETLPPDVLQVVHGADAQGRALVAADIDLIAFTGSRGTGKQILAAASQDLKRVILELGGKDPLLVLDDADPAVAARFAARSSFRNAGQVCVATERIYVDERIADAFEAALVKEAQAFVVGNGLEEGTALGPMVNARQRDHVLAQIEDAVSAGARVLHGGEGHEGNFVVATVLGNVRADMAIAREETFGPVACVTRVKDDEEAIRLANDSPFGLGATVFGGDSERAARVGRRLKAGMIGINKGCGGAAGTPWVGARESGYGYHHSRDGHRQFTQVRVISTPQPVD